MHLGHRTPARGNWQHSPSGGADRGDVRLLDFGGLGV